MATDDDIAELAAAGLQLRESVESAERAALLESDCERARAAWEHGKPIAWPAFNAPQGALSTSELFAFAASVGFTLARSADGFRGSRDPAIALLRLLRRLAEARLAVGRLLTHAPSDGELKEAALHLAYLISKSTPALIHYLRFRRLPVADPTNPDAWASEEDTERVRQVALTWLADAHDDLDSALQTSPLPSAVNERADLAARRILAVAECIASPNPPDPVRRESLVATIRPDRLDQLRSLITNSLEATVGTVHDHERAALLLNALALADLVWDDDETAMRRFVAEVSGWPLRSRVRLNVLLAHLEGTPPDDSYVEALRHALDTIEAESGEEQMLTRASLGLRVLAAIARLALTRPTEASKIAGRFAGFGGSQRRWTSSHAHLWLVPGSPAVGILDYGADAEVVPLEGLSEATLVELTDQHAEEYDQSYDVGGIRRTLGSELKPLAHRLAETAGPVSYYAFGHLKHIPLPALTGKGTRLALNPGMHRLAHRHPQLDSSTQPETKTGRAFVVDRDVQGAFAGVPASPDATFWYDSGNPVQVGVPDAFEQLTAGWEEIVYFGHGYVNQFQSTEVGLVTRFLDGATGFAPAAVFAGFDLRPTRLAVILACGSAQGNVFLEPHWTVADGFSTGGATFVIAPIWPIRTDHAADFLTRLTVRLGRGDDPPAAWAAILEEDPNRFCSITLFTD